MAGFGGHAVVPGLARDMKKPEDFERVINRAFVSAILVDYGAARSSARAGSLHSRPRREQRKLIKRSLQLHYHSLQVQLDI